MRCLRPHRHEYHSKPGCDCLDYVPDQLTVNKYLPGHGIPPHVDTHSAFEDILVSLSLGSAVVMEFAPARVRSDVSNSTCKKDAGTVSHETRSELGSNTGCSRKDPIENTTVSPGTNHFESASKCLVPLTPRSLLVMRGPSRYSYTHGIKASKTDRIDGVLLERSTRVSMTFRKVLPPNPCRCDFPMYCDSRA